MKRTAKLFASIFCAIAALVQTSPAWAATTITVTADKASGTYEAPFSVTLTASDPKARIWYVFDPKAPPGDALPYEKPIRITKSTPLLYFAVADLKNESKVERRDYVIPVTTLRIAEIASIAHDAKSVPVTIQNYGTATAKLAGWTLRTGLETKTFTVGSVAPGASATYVVAYSEGAVALSSPDGEIRSTASVVREAEKPASTVNDTPQTVAVATPSKPVTKPSPEAARPAGSPTSATPESQPESKPAPAETPSQIPISSEETPNSAEPPAPAATQAPTTAPTLSVKASAAESGGASEANKRVAIAVFGIIAAGVLARIASIVRKRRG